MANPQCTAVQKAPASSAVEPKHGKVSPSCVKPLKSCLKKVSSYSDVKEASAALVVEIPTMPRPSSGCALMLSKNNKKSKISPKRVGRRDRIKMREAFSATDSNGNDTAPKRALRRCSTDTTSNASVPDFRRSTTDPSIHFKPLKSILKKPSKTNLSKRTGNSGPLPKKAVSWSDSMQRWNSSGSRLNLKTLASKTTAARRGNYVWSSTTKAPQTTGAPKKSNSMSSLSLLNREVRKFQAPGMPIRQDSDKSLNHSKSLGSSTDLALALALKKSAHARMHKKCLGSESSPNLTLALQQKGLLSPKAATLVKKTVGSNPFATAVADFQQKTMAHGMIDRPQVQTDSPASVRDIFQVQQPTKAPRRPNRQASDGLEAMVAVATP